MAKKTITITNVHCDMCDGEVDAQHEDVVIGYGKKTVTLDLCDKHNSAIDKVLAPAMAAGRKVTGTAMQQQLPGTSGRRSSGSSRAESKAIKEWAAQNGIEVPAMGRIPEQVKQQYREAVGTSR